MAQQTINIGSGNDSGNGEGLRQGGIKINANTTELYGALGFGYYGDSLTIPSITVDTNWTQITIDGLGSNTRVDFLPLSIRGSGTFLSGSIITPESSGDDFDGRLDVTISAKSGSPTYMEVILDFAGSTPDSSRAFTGYIQTAKTPPFEQSLPLDFFSGDTFLANGAKIYARTDSGSFTITDRGIKITRKGKDMAS